MKQKLLLPLLLALLTFFGVQAQTVVFDNFGDGSVWTGVPTTTSLTPSEMKGKVDGTTYTLTVAGAQYVSNKSESGLVIKGSTNTTTPNGYIQLPSFGMKVSQIVVKVSDATFTAGKIALYDLASATPNTAIETKVANEKGITLTYDIPAASQTSYARYMLKNDGAGGTAISSVSVTYAPNQSDKKYVNMSLSAYDVTAVLGRPFTAPTFTSSPAVTPTWSSSKTSVATVDASGKVTLVGGGQTVITASYAGSGAYYAEKIAYTLTVADPLSADGVVYTFADMSFSDNAAVGTTTPVSYTHEQGIVTLTLGKNSATYQPNYGADGGYVRFYTNNSIKVSAIDGYIIDKVEFISTQTRNYLNGVSASTPGNFTPASNGVPAVWTLVDLQTSEATLYPNPTVSPALVTKIVVYLALPKLTMEASKDPINYMYGTKNLNALSNISFGSVDTKGMTFSYASSDESVVSVNATTGAMELLKAGTATVTVSFAGNDYYSANEASYTVNVSGNPVPTIDFIGNTSKLQLNLVTDGALSTYDLKANTTVKLGSTTITDGIQFATENTDVVTVDATTGVITAKAAGTAVITVTVPAATGRDEATANFTVTVVDNRVAPAISYADKSDVYYDGVATFPLDVNVQTLTGLDALSAEQQASLQISVAFEPEAMGTYADGVLKLTGTAGIATVTAVVPESNVNLEASASYKVLVVDPAEGIVLNPASLGIQNGGAVGTVVSDTKLATFAFKSTGYFMAVNNNPAYVNMNANTGALTITAAEGYVIDKVVFTNAAFTETNNTVSAGKLADGTWSFAGLNENSATISNTSTSPIKIENVTVYVRKPIFVISAIEASMSVMNVAADSEDQAMTFDAANNFKVTYGTETLTDVALEYSLWADEEGTVDATVGTIDAETGVVTLIKGVAGTNYVRAAYNGGETYGPATPAVFALVVTEKEPVVFTFNPVAEQNIFGNETIELSTVIASMKANGTDVTLEEGTLSVETDNEAVTYNETENALRITPSTNYTNADIQPETVKVTVTFTPTGDYANTLAESTGVFTFVLADQRQTPVFAYAKTYSLNASDFVAPAPFAAEYESLASDVELSCTNDALVADNKYTVEDLVGVQTGTVTATFPGNDEYKPAKATFVLTVTGDYMTVAQYLAAVADNTLKVNDGVVVKGYVIGTADNDGNLISDEADFNNVNLCIAETADATSDYVIIYLDNNTNATYGLMNNPEYYKAYVEIAGTATSYRKRVSVGSIKSVNAMKVVNIDLADQTIDAKESIVIGVPADYNGTLNVTVAMADGSELAENAYTVAGYRYTFNVGGVYVLNITADAVVAADGWQAVNKTVTITVNGKVQYLPEGRTFISSDLLDNGKFYIEEASTEITYSINGGVSQTYNAAEGISFGESTSGTIAFTATIDGKEETEEFKYEFDTRDVNLGFVVAPTSQMYGSRINYQLSANGKVIASGTMKNSGVVGFDKELYVAAVIVPVSAFGEYEGANVREGQSATNEGKKVGDSNVFFQQPDPVNIVKPSTMESASPFSIVFYSTDSDAEVEFSQAPVAYGSFTQTYDGTTQTIINGMNYSETDVYTPIYLVNSSTLEYIAEVAHSSDASAINLWTGKVTFSTTPVSFFYCTAIDGNSKGTGTFFGVKSGSGAVTDYWAPSTSARAVVKRVAGEDMQLASSNSTSGLTPITYDGANGNSMAVNLLLAQPNNVNDGIYVAGYGADNDDIQTGVEDVLGEADGEVMWFNLQGERIAEPSEGIVIRVQGNKVEKLYLTK